MIRINVGGQTFTTSKNTLTSKCAPNWFSTYLDWKPMTTFIFIDRNPKYFEPILDHIRGYTIALPKDEGELVRLYEDANFYGIKSLICELEKALNIRLTINKREELRKEIETKIKDYEIEYYYPISCYLHKFSDQELLTLQAEVDKYVQGKEQEKWNESIFEGICYFLSKMDKDVSNIKNNKSLILKNLNKFPKETQFFLFLCSLLTAANSSSDDCAKINVSDDLLCKLDEL